MFNDINRKDVSDYFGNLVASDPRLAKYSEDLGVIALAHEMGFKVDKAVKEIQSQFAEFYEPTSEVVLLAKLMYELGYLKFQKPLIVSMTIKSDADVTLERYQRFTDGIDIYVLEEAVSLYADTEHTLYLTRGIVRTISSTMNVDSLYHKIPLNSTYRKIYGLEVRRDNDLLEYSQTFITESSDVSIEVDINGELSVIARPYNVYGKNLLLGDTIEISVFETEPSDTIPTSMAIIGNYDIICTDIIKHRNYEPYLSINDMQGILKFNKNINNSIVYNEDYKRLIRAQIRDIGFIKVWQQEDEDRQNGSQGCNINKVFCSYIPRTEGNDLDSEISNLIGSTVYGKFVHFKTPNVLPITVKIDIVNNSKKSIAKLKQEEVKNIISGYYDDVEKRLSKAILYKNIIETLKEHDIDVSITMTKKSDELDNALFYHIETSEIVIDIIERDA